LALRTSRASRRPSPRKFSENNVSEKIAPGKTNRRYTMEDIDRAAVAYDAYRKANYGIRGGDIPMWGQLSYTAKTMWIEAMEAK